MAFHRQPENRPLLLHRRAGMPHGLQPKIDQVNRLTQEIVKAYRHFGADATHWRDGPARRRLEANRQRLAQLLEAIEQQAPDRAEHIRAAVTQTLFAETQA